MYIYIYICVCVCVCIITNSKHVYISYYMPGTILSIVSGWTQYSQQPPKFWVTFIILHVWMRQLRHRKVKYLVQGHTAGKGGVREWCRRLWDWPPFCIKLTPQEGALVVENPPANRGCYSGDVRDVASIPGLGRSPGGGHGAHSSVLAWRIPWTEELEDYSPWRHKELDATEAT